MAGSDMDWQSARDGRGGDEDTSSRDSMPRDEDYPSGKRPRTSGYAQKAQLRRYKSPQQQFVEPARQSQMSRRTGGRGVSKWQDFVHDICKLGHSEDYKERNALIEAAIDAANADPRIRGFAIPKELQRAKGAQPSLVYSTGVYGFFMIAEAFSQ